MKYGAVSLKQKSVVQAVNLQIRSTFSIFSSLIEAQSKKGTSNFKLRAYKSLPVWSYIIDSAKWHIFKLMPLFFLLLAVIVLLKIWNSMRARQQCVTVGYWSNRWLRRLNKDEKINQAQGKD